jgi:hypothetical protein
VTASLKASAYLVDGVALAATGVALTHDGGGLWSGQEEAVDVATSAGLDGGTIAGGLFQPYTHSTMYLVRGSSFDDTWAKIRALRRRCKPGQTVTLTRQMPDPEGSDANIDLTTTGRRVTDRPDWLGAQAQIDIDWLITGGPWLGSSVTIASAAGTQTILGDLPARKITATLSAGAVNPVITNTSTGNGYTFRYVGTVPTGGVTVDVLTRKATRVSDSGDVSLALKWSKRDPFKLNAGANTITVSSGTCALTYYPAYQ